MIYLVPSDKSVRTDYVIAMQNAVLHVQAFYRDQMPNGHAFSVHSPVVEVYRTPHTSDFYSTGENAGTFGFYNSVLSDGFSLTGGGFNDPNNRWIFYIDAPGGCGQLAGSGGSGVALMAQHDLRGLTGQSNIPRCPGEQPDLRGVCRYVGGLGHELGHSFNLPHPPGCDQGDQARCGDLQFNSLMFLGYSSFPVTHLLDEDRASLSSTGFFAPFNLETPGAGFCSSMTEQTPNPIDLAGYLVRWNYKDFLTREPDDAGASFWTAQITQCGSDPGCIDAKRSDVSGAFFLSIEFRQTGYLVYRTYGAALGTTRVGGAAPLTLAEFLPDVRLVGQGVVVGQADAEARLEANKVAYFDEFVSRPAFAAAYPSTQTAEQFVDALNANTGGSLSAAERNQLAADLASGAKTRAQTLRAAAEDTDFNSAQFNRAFVLMQYFGYLRRNPDDPPNTDFSGYDFWLGKLDDHGGDFRAAEMVKSFIISAEYRGRFGRP